MVRLRCAPDSLLRCRVHSGGSVGATFITWTCGREGRIRESGPPVCFEGSTIILSSWNPHIQNRVMIPSLHSVNAPDSSPPWVSAGAFSLKYPTCLLSPPAAPPSHGRVQVKAALDHNLRVHHLYIHDQIIGLRSPEKDFQKKVKPHF